MTPDHERRAREFAADFIDRTLQGAGKNLRAHHALLTEMSVALLAEVAAEARAEDSALTHRPSALDLDHTACGLPLQRFPIDRNLQLGDGETCKRCTHVVAQVAKARAEALEEAIAIAGRVGLEAPANRIDTPPAAFKSGACRVAWELRALQRKETKPCK